MNLPNAKKINFAKQPYNNLKNRLSGQITESCFDLLNKMLIYDPAQRITAAEALQVHTTCLALHFKHPWFQETPRAKDPDFMPTWPSSHSRKRQNSMDEEQLQQVC